MNPLPFRTRRAFACATLAVTLMHPAAAQTEPSPSPSSIETEANRKISEMEALLKFLKANPPPRASDLPAPPRPSNEPAPVHETPPANDITLTGRVVDAQGQPVPNANLNIAPTMVFQGQTYEGNKLFMKEVYAYDVSKVEETNRAEPRYHTNSDQAGNFTLQAPRERALLYVAADQGYALVPVEEFSGKVALLPWARVEGVISSRGKPLAGQELKFTVSAHLPESTLTYPRARSPIFFKSRSVTTDAQGRYTIERAKAGLALFRMNDPRMDELFGRSDSLIMGNMLTKNGETTRFDLWKPGAKIKGRLIFPPDLQQGKEWNFGSVSLVMQANTFKPPKDGGTEAFIKAKAEFEQSPEGVADKLQFTWLSTPVHPDGTYEFENVPPGRYNLSAFAFLNNAQHDFETTGMNAFAKTVIVNGGHAATQATISLPNITLQPWKKN